MFLQTEPRLMGPSIMKREKGEHDAANSQDGRFVFR